MKIEGEGASIKNICNRNTHIDYFTPDTKGYTPQNPKPISDIIILGNTNPPIITYDKNAMATNQVENCESDKAKASELNHKACSLYKEAETHRKNKLYDKAKECLLESILLKDEAIALDPKRSNFHYNKAIAFTALVRLCALPTDREKIKAYFKEAITSYDDAIALDPEYSKYFNVKGHSLRTMAEIHNNNKEYDKALILYEESNSAYSNAIELDSENKEYRDDQARCINLMGMFTLA